MTEESEQLVIHLSDGSKICVDSNREMTAQQVIDSVFSQLAIQHESVDNSDNKDMNLPVALWVCGESLRLQLVPQNVISKTVEKMKGLMLSIPCEGDGTVTLKLARNGFYDPEEERGIDDLAILKLLYYEAKANIKNNIYPRTSLSDDDMIQLRVIEGILEKDCDDCQGAAKAISTELSYKNSLKKKFLTRRVSKLAKRQDSRPKSTTEDDLCREYLTICHKLNCYGGFIFEGQMERSFLESLTHREYYDKKVSIIINRKGLHVVNKQCPKSKISIKLANLDYGIVIPKKDKYHPCLYVKDAESYPEKMFQIFTYHASFIDKTLKTFIEEKAA